MHDDRYDGIQGADVTASAAKTDAVAALVGAAGKRPQPPQDAYEQVFAAAHDAWHGKLRARRARVTTFALAASVATVAIAAAVVMQLVSRDAQPVVASAGIIQGDVLIRPPGASTWRSLGDLREAIVVGTQLRTTDAGRLALELPGAASLRIDVGTELTLSATTELELSAGTIYIDSGTELLDSAFTVTTPYGTVRDIGTQFEVSTAPDALRVRVRDGAISLDSDLATTSILGSAGEQLSIDSSGSVERDFFSPFGSAWEWVETLAGAPDVEGISLMAFLDWVARESGRELRFDAPVTETRVRTVTLHGDASNLSPMEALDVMLSTTDFEFSLRADGAIVIRPRAR